MRAGRSKDLVAVAALAGALGLGGFLFLRAHDFLGVSWTDGARRFASESTSAVRHAVWSEPERWTELGPSADPSLSSDGRWLVFASGARGHDVELLVAEIVDGVPVEPRPLSVLNSPADELAPAFGEGWLYFASDRAGGAGGLDLWRARHENGVFGRAEPLEPGLNSAAHETDPAPRPGTRTLVFASDRARPDFDLYAAAPDAAGFALPEPLAALNGPGEERGPAFAGDGRSLYFASDRAGGPGGDDLYRAPCFADGWRAPECVRELSSARGERAPWVANDGFALLFERAEETEAGAAGTAWIERARALEIFREPAPAVTLAQWITLAGLLLLALLALLAKRWSVLDIFYKCLLASLVLHLLLMLYLSTVIPEAASVELGPRQGPSFRVRPAGPESAEDEGGAGGALPLVRQPPLPPSARAEAPQVAALAAPPRTPEAAPARANAALLPAPNTAPAPTLAGPAESSERYASSAPELALEARAAPGQAFEPTTPERVPLDAAALGAALHAAPTPEGAELAAAEREAEPAPARQPLEAAARTAAEGADRALDAPALRAPSVLGPPPAASARPEFDATAGLAARAELPGASELGAPVRRAAGEASAERARAAPAPATGLAARPESPLEGAPAPERARVLAGAGDSPAAPELRAPVAERSTPAAPSPSPRFDALAGLAPASAPPRSAQAAPERVAPPPLRELAGARPEPSARVLADLPPEALPAPPERASTPSLADTPYQNRFGELKLRALEEFGGSAETEHAVAAGLAYLARIQGESGAWGQRSDAHEKYLDVRIGKSALALLAFLGAGHVPGGASEHAGVAERTVRYMLDTQDPATGHFGRSCSYGHGIATYALAECYALTRAEALRAPLERALAEVLRHQSRVRDPRAFGGWGYYFADGHVWNQDEWPRTSVTAWQVMALESARLGGLAVPDQAFAGAREFLLNAWDSEHGAFRYDHDPERLASGYPILPASTPAALFALSLLDVDPGTRELAQARRFVLTRAPDGYRYTGDDDFVHQARGNLYFWYYATLAMFRVGGREWERWNAALQATLLPAQDEDGSWRPLDVYSEYAGDEDDERTYSTAMCVLSLEIYYRYFTPLLEAR